MRRLKSAAVLVLAVVIALLGVQPALASPAASRAETAAYFEFDYPPAPDKMVFRLTDPERIQQARDILSGKEKDRIHVMGRIVKRQAPYEPRWSFHIDPDTVTFFEMAIEVCDAGIRYTNDNLDEAGGAFLPGLFWCPWGSRLLREVPAP
jgi:hypothetical protein